MAVASRTNYQFRDFVEMVRSGAGIASEVVQDCEIGQYLEDGMAAVCLLTGFSYDSPFVTSNAAFIFDSAGHGARASADDIVPILKVLGPTTSLLVKAVFQQDGNKGMMVMPRSPTIVAALNTKTINFDILTIPFTTAYSSNAPTLTYTTDLPFSPRIMPLLRMYVESRMRGETADRAYKLLGPMLQAEMKESE